MIIKNINSLEDAINYYLQITKLKDDLIELDFKNSEFIRNNYLTLLGLVLERKKDENKKEIHIHTASKTGIPSSYVKRTFIKNGIYN